MNRSAAVWDDRKDIYRNYLGHQFYTVTDAPYYAYRHHVLLSCLKRWKAGPFQAVLDYGCGCGDTMAAIRRQFPECTLLQGVDISAFMVREAQARVPGALVAQIDTARDTPGAGPLDLIVTTMVLQHCSDDVVCHIFRMFRERLKPSGHVLVMESVTGTPQRSDSGWIGRTGAQYEALMRECGLAVVTSHTINSPVYRRVQPVVRRAAERVCNALGLSRRARMMAVDAVSAPIVAATCLTDAWLSRTSDWGYRVWWLVRA